MSKTPRPILSNGLSADDILRRALNTPPPQTDHIPSKRVKAKRKPAKKAKGR